MTPTFHVEPGGFKIREGQATRLADQALNLWKTRIAQPGFEPKLRAQDQNT
jgi:hypothetical protein